MSELVPEAPSPFKFLDYYEESDRATLGGRDEDSAAIVAGITKSRSFVLYGRSGIGKTSVLLAGVFPLLRGRGWVPIYVRMLENPTADLHERVAAELGEPATCLSDQIRKLAERRRAPLVFVVDQFEEFFVRFRDAPAVRGEFIKHLAEIAQLPVDLRLVFSLREDYLAELDDLVPALPLLSENRYRLLPLTAYGARQAITKPLHARAVTFDPLVVSSLLDQLAEFGFDPIMLQIVCFEAYQAASRRSSGRVEVAKADLEQIGGVRGIFRRYLSEVAALCTSDEQRLLLQMVLHALMSRERTKRAMAESDFDKGAFHATPEDIRGVLALLKKKGLVREERRASTVWYELAHERLVEITSDWLLLDRGFHGFIATHDLIATCAKGALWRTTPEMLLHQDQLRGMVRPYGKWLRLEVDETEYVLWSAIYRGSEDLQYWAEERFGREKTLALLKETLLEDQVPEMRSAAARAALQWGVRDTALADRLAHLAVHDPDPMARRDAGAACAAIGGASQFELIRQALADDQLRPHALAALGHCLGKGGTVRGLGRWDRWRAHRLFKRRTYEENKAYIRDHASAGLFGAFVAALAWWASGGLLFGEIIWAIGAEAREALGQGAGEVVTSLVAALLIAPPLGYLACRTDARRLMLGRKPSWLRALLRSPGYWLLPSLCAAVFLLTILGSKPHDRAEIALILLLCLIPWLAIPILVQGARRFLPDAKSGHLKILATLLPWGVGMGPLPPLLLAAVFAHLSTPKGLEYSTSVPLLVCIMAPLLGLFTTAFAGALTLARLSHPAEAGSHSKAKRVTWPWLSASLLALVVGQSCVVYLWGRDVLPPWSRRITLSPGARVNVPVGDWFGAYPEDRVRVHVALSDSPRASRSGGPDQTWLVRLAVPKFLEVVLDEEWDKSEYYVVAKPSVMAHVRRRPSGGTGGLPPAEAQSMEPAELAIEAECLTDEGLLRGTQPFLLAYVDWRVGADQKVTGHLAMKEQAVTTEDGLICRDCRVDLVLLSYPTKWSCQDEEVSIRGVSCDGDSRPEKLLNWVELSARRGGVYRLGSGIDSASGVRCGVKTSKDDGSLRVTLRGSMSSGCAAGTRFKSLAMVGRTGSVRRGKPLPFEDPSKGDPP